MGPACLGVSLHVAPATILDPDKTQVGLDWSSAQRSGIPILLKEQSKGHFLCPKFTSPHH